MPLSSERDGDDFWDGAEELVELRVHEEVRQTIFAKRVRLGTQSRLGAVVCQVIEMGTQCVVNVAYVERKAQLGTGSEVKHLFRMQGSELNLGVHAVAPRGPILPSNQWQLKAREFLG